ncbi:hypothetical protein QBC45DRAFT_328072, partial [Copromyces sp. CBS 386.78]
FFVTKKDKSIYLINNVQKINRITLRNINPRLSYKKFNESFRNYKIIFLFNFFSNYN